MRLWWTCWVSDATGFEGSEEEVMRVVRAEGGEAEGFVFVAIVISAE